MRIWVPFQKTGPLLTKVPFTPQPCLTQNRLIRHYSELYHHVKLTKLSCSVFYIANFRLWCTIWVCYNENTSQIMKCWFLTCFQGKSFFEYILNLSELFVVEGGIINVLLQVKLCSHTCSKFKLSLSRPEPFLPPAGSSFWMDSGMRCYSLFSLLSVWINLTGKGERSAQNLSRTAPRIS